MSKVKFELNRQGVAQLMKSGAMQSILKSEASSIKSKAGTGYQQDVYVGKNRANARVWADTNDAIEDNSTRNTLLKSVR